MAKDLTEKQLKEMRYVFDYIDKNGDGTISRDEMGFAIRLLKQNPTKDDLANLMKADMDGNDMIDFDEFCQAMVNYTLQPPEAVEKELYDAFKVFDKDGNGYIDAKELKSTMTHLGESMTDKEVEAMIQEADVDGDHKINYTEFVKMMMLTD